MAQQTLNIGSTANDGTGDPLRTAMDKVNDNFNEIYASPLFTEDIVISGNEIRANRSNDDLVFKPSGTGSVSFPAIRINDNNIEAIRSNDNIHLKPSGTGSVVFGALKINGTSLSSDDSTIININDGLVIDGTMTISGSSTLTGGTNINSTLDVPSGLTTLSTLSVTGTTNLSGPTTIDNLIINDNNISSSSNAAINLSPGGTGEVYVYGGLNVDDNVQIRDNQIRTIASNSDLEIIPSGTGKVVIGVADINSGNIDNTIIGSTTPLAGIFTTVTATTSAVIDGITISDNKITTNASNSNLELTGNGTGTVTISGFSFPTSDGTSGQFLKTDGLGNLAFATAGATLLHSDIADATTTVASSATSVINTFPITTYRSAKYFISITDTTNSRFEFVEANVIHDGTNAYISSYGSTSNYTGAPTLSDLTVDVSGGDVRLLGTNISDNTCVFKFQRTAIDI